MSNAEYLLDNHSSSFRCLGGNIEISNGSSKVVALDVVVEIDRYVVISII